MKIIKNASIILISFSSILIKRLDTDTILSEIITKSIILHFLYKVINPRCFDYFINIKRFDNVMTPYANKHTLFKLNLSMVAEFY